MSSDTAERCVSTWKVSRAVASVATNATRTVVVLIVANETRSRGTVVDGKSVVESGGGDTAYQLTYAGHIIRQVLAAQVDVLGWPTRVVGGQQHTALEDRLTGVGGAGEPGQESLQGVELVQLDALTTLPAGEIL